MIASDWTSFCRLTVYERKWSLACAPIRSLDLNPPTAAITADYHESFKHVPRALNGSDAIAVPFAAPRSFRYGIRPPLLVDTSCHSLLSWSAMGSIPSWVNAWHTMALPVTICCPFTGFSMLRRRADYFVVVRHKLYSVQFASIRYHE